MIKQIDALIDAKKRIDVFMNSLEVNEHSNLVEELKSVVENFETKFKTNLDELLDQYADIYGKHAKLSEQSKPFM
jgi:uncharacterized protein YeeX (DUF496 family)